MNQITATIVEIRHQLRVFIRNPIAAAFTLGFPLFFFLLLNALQGQSTVGEGDLRFSQYFTPSIAVFGMVTAGFTNIAIGVAIDRDEGILKRVRATPQSPTAYMAARIGAGAVIGLASVALMTIVGMALFGVSPPWSRMPIALSALLLGSATFSALGLAVAGLAPNGQAAPVLANVTILPMVFISGIFFPIEGGPKWLIVFADILPLKPMTDAFRDPWIEDGGGVPWRQFAILGIWLGIGTVVARMTFTWDPRPAGRPRSRPE